MMKKAFSKSMAWILSVVMIFGAFVSSAIIFVGTSLSVSAAETYGDFEFVIL